MTKNKTAIACIDQNAVVQKPRGWNPPRLMLYEAFLFSKGRGWSSASWYVRVQQYDTELSSDRSCASKIVSGLLCWTAINHLAITVPVCCVLAHSL